MYVSRINLNPSGAQYTGPKTQWKPPLDVIVVSNEAHVVVLWVLKLEA